MKEITPKDSRYIPIVQQKSCCVPACVSMVMYRNGIKLIPQELLGYHLGLTIAQENLKLFWHPRSGKKPTSGYGTQIYLKKYHPNTVFPKLKIPLRMIYHPISKFTNKSFKKFLIEAIKKDKDILVCFDHGELSGDHAQGGHVCVVDKINAKKDIVRLIDPQQSQPKWRLVKISRLKSAMDFHSDNKSAGFWELTKTSWRRRVNNL